ncbi:MAG: hypothetical protein ABII06_21865 [Pseudomonadota bacterium]
MMGKKGQTREAVRTWLESAEAQGLLEKTAGWVLDEATRRSLSPSFIGARILERERDWIIEDICQELAALIQEESVQGLVLDPKNRSPGRNLKRIFINRWVDFSRKKDTETPWHYLYRRVQRALSEASDDFVLYKEEKGRNTRFSAPGPSIPCGPLAEEDLKEIPFPPGLADRLVIEKIAGKKNLLELAAHFLKEISRRFYQDEQVRVRLNDFVTWLGLYVVLRHGTIEDPGTEGRDPLDLVVSTARVSEPGFDPCRVRKWAGMLAERLEPGEKKAFYMKWGEGRPLRVIAGTLGYKGESGSKYLIDQAEEKMQAFTRDLEWLSPENPDNEARSLFKETLMEILKKGLSKP